MPRSTPEGPADRPRDPVPEDPQDRGRAQIELGKLLALARAGRNPDSGVIVAELLDAYVPVAGWNVSTEEANLGYIRRTIKPALGAKEVCKVRGPLLDNLFARCRSAATWRVLASRSLSTARPRPATRPGRPQDGMAADGRQAPRSYHLRCALHPVAARPRLPAVWLPATCLPPDETQHHPRHPRHPVGCVRSRQRWEWADFNPAASAKPPTVTKKTPPLSRAQWSR